MGIHTKNPDREGGQKGGCNDRKAQRVLQICCRCLRNFIEIARSASQEDLAMACRLIERDVKESDNLRDQVLLSHGLVFLDCRVMSMRDEAMEEGLVKAV